MIEVRRAGAAGQFPTYSTQTGITAQHTAPSQATGVPITAQAGGDAETEGAASSSRAPSSSAGPQAPPSASPPPQAGGPSDALNQLLASGQIQFTRHPQTGRINGVRVPPQRAPGGMPMPAAAA